MKTSYFGYLKHITNPLSISGKAPDWYVGPQCRKLAPKWEFFSAYRAGEIDEDEYTKEFYEQVLKPLSARDMYEFLTKTYGDDVILLCYEKPGEFCHRRIVAGWFEEALGVDVPEYTNTPSKYLQF
jgi:hypothetical protein